MIASSPGPSFWRAAGACKLCLARCKPALLGELYPKFCFNLCMNLRAGDKKRLPPYRSFLE